MIEFSTLDMLLMHYAAGSLGPMESLMVASHLAMRPDARKRVAAFEAMGAKMMCDDAPAKVSNACLDGLLKKIDTPMSAEPAIPAHCRETARRLQVPDSVFALLSGCNSHNQYSWVRVTNGMDMIDVRISSPNPCRHTLRLMRAAPKHQAPAHGHDGTEITLVLAGSYADQFGRYSAGDIVIINDANIAHAPTAGDDGCVTLVLTEAPVRIKNPIYRFMNVFFRI